MKFIKEHSHLFPVIIFVIFFLVVILNSCSPAVMETRPIKSCQLLTENKETASGSFVLFVGSFDYENETELRYYMYIKGNEGYKLQWVDSYHLEIVETDEVEPCIKGNFSQGEINYYADTGGKREIYSEYIVYVPVGTIYEKYDANLK